MVLFKNPGIENTEETLRIAIDELKESGLRTLVISSTRGYSAEKALEVIPEGIKLIIVTHHYGFKKENECEFPEDLRKRIVERGYHVLTATHTLSGIERTFRKEFGGLYPTEIVANTLRLFCEGVKVCVEIAVMCADAGLVRTDEWVVTCAGTSKGLDTAMVIKPSNSNRFFDLRIGKVLCMPSSYV